MGLWKYLSSVKELETLRNNATPTNTHRNTSFAVKLYNMWYKVGHHLPLDCGCNYLLDSSIPKFLPKSIIKMEVPTNRQQSPIFMLD